MKNVCFGITFSILVSKIIASFASPPFSFNFGLHLQFEKPFSLKSSDIFYFLNFYEGCVSYFGNTNFMPVWYGIILCLYGSSHLSCRSPRCVHKYTMQNGGFWSQQRQHKIYLNVLQALSEMKKHTLDFPHRSWMAFQDNKCDPNWKQKADTKIRNYPVFAHRLRWHICGVFKNLQILKSSCKWWNSEAVA